MGEPADEIVNYASKNSFNLIVMATHGRSGIGRWVKNQSKRHVTAPLNVSQQNRTQ